MRKVIVSEFVSLDGVMESPDEWHFPSFNDEMGQAVGSAMAEADAMLMGRVLYEEWAAFWPNQDPDENPFAARMNGVRKYMVSTTLEEPLEWQNSTLIGDNVAEEISRLKEQQGHLDIRQRHPRPVAAARRPDRRAPAHGPSDRRGQREVPLRGRRRQ